MKQHQSGVALIAAIFIVVIIGAAIVVLASLSIRNTQQTTQNLLQAKASQAAGAGIEATVQRLLRDSDGPHNWCDGSEVTVAVPAYTDFDVAVRCSQNSYHRPSRPLRLFDLRASAAYGTSGSADHVWVQIDAAVEL